MCHSVTSMAQPDSGQAELISHAEQEQLEFGRSTEQHFFF